jgi:predicted RNase H-like HicB family nuclease
MMTLCIEFEREEDGRWIAEIPKWPGALAYGATKEEAARKAEAIALRAATDSMDLKKSNPTGALGRDPD